MPKINFSYVFTMLVGFRSLTIWIAVILKSKYPYEIYPEVGRRKRLGVRFVCEWHTGMLEDLTGYGANSSKGRWYRIPSV